MAFDINKFKSTIGKRGVLPTNKFKVVITPPAGLGNAIQRTLDRPNSWSSENFDASIIASDLEFYCDAVTMPGVNLLTSENRRYGIGSPQKAPIGAIFQEITMSFICDSHGENVRFFQNWLKLIVNYDAREGYRTNTGIGDQYPHEVSYRFTEMGGYNYASDIRIHVYDNTGDIYEEPRETLLYVLREAYPVFISDVPLNWADNNNIMRLPVTFTYFDWYEKYISRTSPGGEEIGD